MHSVCTACSGPCDCPAARTIQAGVGIWAWHSGSAQQCGIRLSGLQLNFASAVLWWFIDGPCLQRCILCQLQSGDCLLHFETSRNNLMRPLLGHTSTANSVPKHVARTVTPPICECYCCYSVFPDFQHICRKASLPDLAVGPHRRLLGKHWNVSMPGMQSVAAFCCHCSWDRCC